MAELRLLEAGGVEETLAFFDACRADGAAAGILEAGSRVNAPATTEAGLVLWTSGSTGTPRGVRFGHAGVEQMARVVADYLELGPTDRVGIALPLHYSYALVGQALAGRAAGATLVDVRGAPLQEALTTQQITVFSGVPALLRQLVEAIEDGAPAAPLRVVCSAGAPLSCALARRVRAALPDAVLWNQYGTTELGPRLAAIPHHDPAFVAALAAGTEPPAGRLLAGAEARVRGGVLEARTPWQALGELDGATDPDAWISTGDIADLDGDLVTVSGRADHVLLVGGEKVHPRTLEQVLERAGVEAAVVGRDHRRLGQVPIAFAVGDPAIEPELWAAIRAELPPRARPASITWLDALPRLASGKLDRHALRAR